jgi:hypothetical protein
MGRPPNSRHRDRFSVHGRAQHVAGKLPILHPALRKPVAALQLRAGVFRVLHVDRISDGDVLRDARTRNVKRLAQERSISTAITFADFFISNAIVQLTYCLLWLALYIASDEYAGDMHSSGLWVMWMIYAVRISESDLGGSIQPCCLPIRIKKRLYPLLAMLLLGVAQWQFPYDLVVAYVVGVVACRMFDGSFIKLTNNAYKRLETSFLLSWMSQRDDFCTISSSPKSQFFCADSIHNYKEFYANFMTKASDDGQDPAPDTIPGGPAQGFNEVNGMSTGPVIARNIVSLDDIRNHWTTKDAEVIISFKVGRRG